MSKNDMNKRIGRILGYESQSEMRQKQTLLLSLFFQKLQRKQSVKMNCKGDSITYGLDLTSPDKRPPDPDQPDPNSTRASTTYPEFLQTIMDRVYPGLVTIHKISKPGMTAEGAVKAWTTNNQADISLLMLGMNDAAYGGLKAFLGAYRQVIERELSWNTACIMLLPTKIKEIQDMTTDVFRGSLIQLANEYGIPCLDLGKELLNIPSSLYSNTAHFNGKGYKFLAAKIGGFLINGTCLYPTKVSNSSLLIRERMDGVLFLYVDDHSIIHQNMHPTSDDMLIDKGMAVSLKPGGKMLYSMYTEQDNLVCFPAAYLGGNNIARLTLTLNFGVETQRISNSNSLGFQKAGATFDSSVTYTTPKDGNFYPNSSQTSGDTFTTNISGIRSLEEKMLLIPKSGYHTILVENTSQVDCIFYGLDFKPYGEIMNQVYAHQIR
ncbi:GDSL-type esterase/lipase family protein [Bacillus cereus group sp. RP43]|uniref:SGNH/GDSL hydrolase family protein n=1 Tax=Bacillus cereus group sp. RP43 TaxID=3040260 RepID=UPI003391789E